MSTAQDILRDLVEQLKTLARTETVVGAPFSAGEFTVVPVSRVSLGVGAGGGSGKEEKKSATGEGGGGGGIRVTPVALVAVRGGELHVHMLSRGASLTHLAEKMPDLLEKSLEKFMESLKMRKEKE